MEPKHTRRKVIAMSGAGIATVLAGCSSDSSEDMEGSTRDDGNESNSGNGGGGDGEANVEIVDHELVVEEGDFSTDVYVEATVENTGEGPSGNMELQADWYNSGGDYLDNDSQYLITLGPGETWEGQVRHLGSGGEDVDDYELEGDFDESRSAEAETLELVESELEVGEDEAVVRGEVENTGDETESYVAVVAKMYDEEGVVLGDEWTNVTDLRDGETWSFDVTWRGRDRTSRVDDYEVLVTDTV